MFIGSNFHKNSSFNYKNSGNKAIRFGCYENGMPCKPIREATEILEANNADHEKAQLYIKYMLLFTKRNGVSHEDAAPELLKRVKSDPKGYAENINNIFDLKCAEKYIELNTVDPLDKAKEILTDAKANPKKANILVDTMFRLFNKVMEIPYEEAANMVLGVVKEHSKDLKKILSSIPISKIPERFLIVGDPEALEEREINFYKTISRSQKPEKLIPMVIISDTDEEIGQKRLIEDMTRILKPYKVTPEKIEIFVGQALKFAEEDNIPVKMAILSLSTATQLDPEHMAKNIKSKHRVINELKANI